MLDPSRELRFKRNETLGAGEGLAGAKEANDQIGLQGLEPLIRRFVEPVSSVTGSPAVSGRSEDAKLFRTRVGPGTVAGGVGPKCRCASFVTHVANEQLMGGESFMEGGFEMPIVHHASSEAAAQQYEAGLRLQLQRLREARQGTQKDQGEDEVLHAMGRG